MTLMYLSCCPRRVMPSSRAARDVAAMLAQGDRDHLSFKFFDRFGQP